MRPRKHVLHFVEKWKEKFHTRNTKCGKPAQTSGEESTPFYGTLQKLRIVSNRICYGPVPEPGEEVEQHLTINVQGDVWFSGYVYTRENRDYKKTRCKHFKIGAASAANLLKKVEFHFATKRKPYP